MMRRLRKDDPVVILAGKDKGRQGDIVRFVGHDRVVVANINTVVKHQKQGKPGERHGLIEKEAALHISNVAIFNHHTEKADKIGLRTDEDGKKVRFFRSSGTVIDEE